MSYRGDSRSQLLGSRAHGKVAAEHSENILRQQNDALINDLHKKVGVLKDLSIDIHRETKEHNAYLDGLTDDFGKAGGLLKGTIAKLTSMMANGGSKHICVLVFFVFFFFLLLWRLIKH